MLFSFFLSFSPHGVLPLHPRTPGFACERALPFDGTALWRQRGGMSPSAGARYCTPSVALPPAKRRPPWREDQAGHSGQAGRRKRGEHKMLRRSRPTGDHEHGGRAWALPGVRARQWHRRAYSWQKRGIGWLSPSGPGPAGGGLAGDHACFFIFYGVLVFRV